MTAWLRSMIRAWRCLMVGHSWYLHPAPREYPDDWAEWHTYCRHCDASCEP